MSDPAIRVLVVDDEPIVRHGIALVLGAEPGVEVVGQAGDGAAAIAAVADMPAGVDVVVMDLRMPGTDGVEATRAIAARADAPAVLVLTTFQADDAVYAALRAGARGFVLKVAVPQELVLAVRAVAAGGCWLDAHAARVLVEDVAASPDPHRPAPPELASLTPREREVLQLVADGRSNAEIAAALVVGEGTVKTHVSRILMKLGLRDRAQAVAAAFHTGLVPPRHRG